LALFGHDTVQLVRNVPKFERTFIVSLQGVRGSTLKAKIGGSFASSFSEPQYIVVRTSHEIPALEIYFF